MKEAQKTGYTYDIGLCLSGGGALGFAHIGALQALCEQGIRPEYISGASVGAIIGVLFAEGYTPADILRLSEDYKLYDVFHIVKTSTSSLRAQGISRHDKIKRMLYELIPHDSFDLLKTRFCVSVVDICKPEWEIVGRGGNLISYVLASMSVPLVFVPEVIGHKLYVDGGVMNNLPVEPLRESCRWVIGVDVQDIGEVANIVDKTHMLKRYYGAMMKQIQRPRVAMCDTYIHFPELEEFAVSDFRKYKDIYRIGYDTTSRYLETHPVVFSTATPCTDHGQL